MVTDDRRTGAPIWAYAYEIVPPQPEIRLDPIRELLRREQAEARHQARSWSGRIVLANLVTNILVVSDTPDQTSEANRRLQAALRELEVAYSLIPPLNASGEAP